jgi:alpha-tubulin suppressor-like RCC1 family protein
MKKTASLGIAISRAAFIVAITALANLCPTAVATSASIPMSFGYNGYGHTGLGSLAGNTLVATPIDLRNLAGKNVNQVAAGQLHSLLLADDGTVYSFGANVRGNTGLGITSGNTLVATPIDTTNLAGKKIVQISAGHEFSLLLADDGTVFSFGWNIAAQTGRGITTGSTNVATPILTNNLGGKKVVKVAAGASHSFLLTDDGSVYTFGSNAAGKTGRNTEFFVTSIATPINAANLGGRKVTDIAAGYAHSLLLTDDGMVYSMGWNDSGRTGLSIDTGNTLVPIPIIRNNFRSRRITQIAAGGHHSLLLASDGTVFAFGDSEFGQTGQGVTFPDTLIATRIDPSSLQGKPISQIAAGFYHSLLLARDGTVFSFGDNDFGKTGQGVAGFNTLVAFPIDPTNLSGLRAIHIAAGWHHSLVLLVPEPSTVGLLVLVGLPLFAVRYRPQYIHFA